MKRLALNLCVGFIAFWFVACDKNSRNATEIQKAESNNAISQTTTRDSIESINVESKNIESRNTTTKLETAQMEMLDDKDSQCNINGESTLYNEWVERWKGSYEADIYYHTAGTPGAINDMIRECDIKGLELMLDDIGAREFILHQESGGTNYLLLAITEAKPKVVDFLLANKLTQKDNQELYKSHQIDYDGNTPLQLATQKLKEAKAKDDKKQ